MEFIGYGLRMTVPPGWTKEESPEANSHRIVLKGPAREQLVIRVFAGTMPVPLALEAGRKLLAALAPGATPQQIQEALMGESAHGLRIMVRGTKDTMYGKLLVQMMPGRTIMVYAQFLESAREQSFAALNQIMQSMSWA